MLCKNEYKWSFNILKLFHWSFIEKTYVKQSMKCKVCPNLGDQLAELPPTLIGSRHHGKIVLSH